MSRTAENIASEIVAIAERVADDGKPLYAKEDIRQALPLLFVSACPVSGTLEIPAAVRELLQDSLDALALGGTLTRREGVAVVQHHYERHPPTSSLVAAIEAYLGELAREARGAGGDPDSVRELLGLAGGQPLLTQADGETVFRAGPLARAQLSKPK